MPMTPEHTRETIAAYAAAYPDERAALSTVLEALDRGDDVASRNTVPVHVTAGAVLLNERGEVLFVHHKALDRYLMPGGHLEHEDVNLMGAALRELAEETGIRTSITARLPDPVHIDVHEIPANDSKGEPAHHHADVRYLFSTTGAVDLSLQDEEVSGYVWRSPDAIEDERLRSRVIAAVPSGA